MEKFYQNKFFKLIDRLHFKNYIGVSNDYHHFTEYIKYPIALGFGLIFSLIANIIIGHGALGMICYTLLLSFPMALIGLFPAKAVQMYLKETNFAFFRRYKYFSSLQDSYFYISKQLREDLQKPENQYVIPHFYELLSEHIKPEEGRVALQNHIINFKKALAEQRLNDATEIFFELYPYSIQFGDRIDYDTETEYEKRMLLIQAEMIEEFLGTTVEHEKEIELEKETTAHIKEIM
jgi:hypothetical protein